MDLPTSPMGPSRRASGWAQRAAESASLQRQYRANPSACVRRILFDSPPLYCNVAEDKMVTHITAAYAESPPLNPTPDWLFPPRDGKDTDGDVLSEPFSPKEVVSQFRRHCPWSRWTYLHLEMGGPKRSHPR